MIEKGERTVSPDSETFARFVTVFEVDGADRESWERAAIADTQPAAARIISQLDQYLATRNDATDPPSAR